MLLTLAASEGSSYQPVGAYKWVAPERSSIGMISGGCLEEHFIDLALNEPLEVARNWQHIIDTSLPEDRLLGTGLGCRGRLTVKFEVLPPDCPRRRQIIASQLSPALTVHIVGSGADVPPVVELLRWRGWGAVIFARSHGSNSQELADFACRPLDYDALAAALCVVRGPKILAVMTHHFQTDLELLRWLCQSPKSYSPKSQMPPQLDYLGLLGSRQRSDQLWADLNSHHDSAGAMALKDALHAPLGLPGFGKGQHAVALSLVSQLQQLFGTVP